MQLVINGETQSIDNVSSVATLVEALGVNTRKAAVEVNAAIVPRSTYGDVVLHDGDRIEIVQFIGGG